jgi:hypothetical protein
MDKNKTMFHIFEALHSIPSSSEYYMILGVLWELVA